MSERIQKKYKPASTKDSSLTSIISPASRFSPQPATTTPDINTNLTISPQAPLTTENPKEATIESQQPSKHDLSRIPIYRKQTVSQPNDPREQEADNTANQVIRMPEPGNFGTENKIQRFPGHDFNKISIHSQFSTYPQIQRASDNSVPTTTTVSPDAGGTSAISSSATPTNALIVEDTVEPIQPEQMHKSEFLSQLRTSINRTVDTALAELSTVQRILWAPMVQLEIDRQFDIYSTQNSQTLESYGRRYAPRATQATDYIPAICEQVRGAIVQQVVPNSTESTSTPESISTGETQADSETTDIFFKERSGGAINVDDPKVIQAELGQGRSLDSDVTSKMGTAFGEDFAQVRLHTDGTAAKLSDEMNAKAFTIGEHVAFATGQYQPGTMVGDALIAHELAHVVQQKGASSNLAHKGQDNTSALETDADMSAIGAVSALWFGAKGALTNLSKYAMPRLKSGLGLRRCSSCGSGSSSTPSLLSRLQAITDAEQLAAQLESLSSEQLTQLLAEAPANSMLAQAVRWEVAVRGKNWSSLSGYHRSDTHGFHRVYIRRIVSSIMQGQTPIRVNASEQDQEFARWVESQFQELGSKPTGFRLIIELLAAGQTVNINSSAGANVNDRVRSEQNPNAGSLITTDDQGNQLPPEQQRRGIPTGSNISLNRHLIQNQVVLGGTAGNLQIIEAEQTVTFGHELIHALHNARGENIAPPMQAGLYQAMGRSNYLVRDPATGEPVSAEELHTITGQTSFQAPSSGVAGQVNWPLSYNLPAQDAITENMLREERGLPARAGHVGGTRAYQVTVRAGETLEQMLGRYYMDGGGSVPPAIMTNLRSVFLEFNAYFREHSTLPPEVPEMQIDFPHGEYMALHMAYVVHQPDIAENAKRLRVRGANP